MMALWIILLASCLYLCWKQPFILSPTGIFFAYYAFIFPIPYLVSYYLQLPSAAYGSPSEMPSGMVHFALFQIVVGLAAFCIGRFLIPSPRIGWPALTIVKSQFLPLILVSTGAAIAGGLVVLHQIGGIQALIEDSGAIRSGGLSGLGAGTFAVNVLLPTVAQFGLMYAFRNKSKFLWPILALSVLSCLLGAAFGFRGIMFCLFIQVASICHLMTGRSYRKRAVFGILVLGLLLSALGFLRIVIVGQSKAADALLLQDPMAAVGVLSDTALTRTRGVEAVILMTDYMNHADYHYFIDNITETARSIIPSFILPKGISLSETIGTTVYGSYLRNAGNDRDVYGGCSYTLIGEGYWNLGVAGIVIVCTMAGYALRVVEFRDRTKPVSYLQVILYKTMAGAVVVFMESPQLGVNGIAISLLLNLGILAFMSVVIRII